MKFFMFLNDASSMAPIRTHPTRPAHMREQAGRETFNLYYTTALNEIDSSGLGLELLVADTEFIATITHQVA
jgi:hypothetical protein